MPRTSIRGEFGEARLCPEDTTAVAHWLVETPQASYSVICSRLQRETDGPVREEYVPGVTHALSVSTLKPEAAKASVLIAAETDDMARERAENIALRICEGEVPAASDVSE